ncbi:PaaX family transcriptional regulator C-terminal domain-containing protein [Streptomyces solicathayae]|uniref:PaaX family transcriptional regulator C-terminal domain-containing protein n=1 Tax=Streptomyces solicathayae TaxID=3081768 RepID=A0ABZ0LR80_9ACTN|nr:PaaX family transcriptional regulator C-terminal domain-containing protein [Streptomyces sp. HUAS YS2]WOX21314.1 PaaX family transcriptional regulator C-terminal domain-containing protein [Streptomyces sp. HUAS YS2]
MTHPAPPARTASAAEPGSPPRPQSLMLSFFGIHVLGTGTALSSASVIDAFARVDVGEDAVRSTLTRMVSRGLLERHRRGRRMYFSLTPRAAEVLADGEERIHRRGAVNRGWDGTWTLVGFSLPESWRSERHDLRSRLVWAGFGPLQSGLWVAPGCVDVAPIAAELGLGDRIRAFHGEAAAPTEAGPLLRTAFDVDAIAGGYRSFLARWGDGPGPAEVRDDLGRQLVLHTDWLDLVRRDPHLPAEHLPEDWPAVRAEALFRDLAARYAPGARAIAEEILDRWEPEPPPAPGA